MYSLPTDSNEYIRLKDNIASSLDVNLFVWGSMTKKFNEILFNYDATVERLVLQGVNLLVDSLGVAPGYDFIIFKSEEDALMFILKEC